MINIYLTSKGYAIFRCSPYGGRYYFAKIELIANGLESWEVGQLLGGN